MQGEEGECGKGEVVCREGEEHWLLLKYSLSVSRIQLLPRGQGKPSTV